MTDDKRFYGIYEGVCVDNEDPDYLNKIKVQVPQILGEEITDWAKPCLPVIANANHPDHISHTAAQVAALLINHTDVITTSSVSDGGLGASAHTHTVTLNAHHSGNSGTLSHPHKTSTDTLDTNTASPQHTYHRTIPNIGQKVWVMFIAGDPNFPVWMGVEI
jgi:hypothetical protein